MIPNQSLTSSNAQTVRQMAARLTPIINRFTVTFLVAWMVVFPFYLPRADREHFPYLAESLLQGAFTVNHIQTFHPDLVHWGENLYIPLAPMPAILLMPFVAVFGVSFDDRWLAILSALATCLVIWRVLQHLEVPRAIRKTCLILFFLGTIYLASLVEGRSWFLSHIVATLFMFLAIDEALSTRRALLIGIWGGLAFLTRSPTVFALPAFLYWLRPAETRWSDMRWLGQTSVRLAFGYTVAFFFFGYYNYARFGSVFETGYGLASVATPTLFEAMSFGLFSPIHLAKNIYSFLLAMPQAYPSFNAPVLEFPYLYPSPWGMGLFFTTPAFICIFSPSWRDRVVRGAWLGALLVLIPLVFYYGVGWIQFGYRYALDLYPFLFVLVALGFKTRPRRFLNALVGVCVAINVWGAWWQAIGFFSLPFNLLK